jgi:hypothetical protein
MGNISRSTMARFNDSANGSAKQQAKAMQRHCLVTQTMVPVYRNIRNCGMIRLMRQISHNTGEGLRDNAYQAFER